MKNKFFTVSIFLITILMLQSCSFITTIFPLADELLLQVLADYSVHGCSTPDLKGRSCELIETDDYERVLYFTEIDDMFSGEVVSVVGICQKFSQKFVYFYEDICYIKGEANDEQIEELKKANDWNLQINENKLSYRKVNVSLDLFIIDDCNLSMSKLRSEFCTKTGYKENDLDCGIDDVNENGKYLFVFITGVEEDRNFFFVITDNNYNIAVMAVEDITEFTTELIQFKTDNDWYN